LVSKVSYEDSAGDVEDDYIVYASNDMLESVYIMPSPSQGLSLTDLTTDKSKSTLAATFSVVT